MTVEGDLADEATIVKDDKLEDVVTSKLKETTHGYKMNYITR